jgi:hypothetical protein
MRKESNEKHLNQWRPAKRPDFPAFGSLFINL